MGRANLTADLKFSLTLSLPPLLNIVYLISAFKNILSVFLLHGRHLLELSLKEQYQRMIDNQDPILLSLYAV